MSNRLTFSINTDAPYSQEELDDLLGEFVDWISDADGDVDKGSADIDFGSSDAKQGDEEKIREAATGLIANGVVEVSFRVLDIDNNVIAKNNFSTED